MARLFFAVGVTSEVVSALEPLRARLERSGGAGAMRFVALEQAHCTLRFLGEQDADRQAAAVRAGQAAARGVRPFCARLRGLGVFPDERRPHTLWIGADEGARELAALAGRLEDKLFAEGFSREERPFVLHLTLARIKRRLPAGAIRALLDSSRETIAPLAVDRFVLMESRQVGDGVRYTPVATFPLEVPCTPS